MRIEHSKAIAASAVALAASLAFAPAALGEEVSALSGDFEAEGISIDVAGGAPALRAGERSIPLAEVKSIRFRAPDPIDDPSLARVFLAGGDMIRGQVAGGKDDEEIVVRSPSLGAVALKLQQVRGFLLGATPRAAQRFEHEEIPKKRKGDRVVLKAGGSYDGLVERIGSDGVKMRADDLGDLPPIPFEKLEAVLLAELGPPPKHPDELFASALLRDGSRVAGRVLGLEGGRLQLATFFAARLAVSADALATLFIKNGRVVYVSDLEPIEAKESSFWIGTVFHWQRDRNCLGNPLRLDGRTYAKGIGVHARAELAFDLGGRYEEFRSMIGLDDEAREVDVQVPVGAVFQVVVDGKPHFAGGLPMKRSDKARYIAVDVRGAKEIRLVVDFAEVGSPDTLSRANWADAHLVR